MTRNQNQLTQKLICVRHKIPRIKKNPSLINQNKTIVSQILDATNIIYPRRQTLRIKTHRITFLFRLRMKILQKLNSKRRLPSPTRTQNHPNQTIRIPNIILELLKIPFLNIQNIKIFIHRLHLLPLLHNFPLLNFLIGLNPEIINSLPNIIRRLQNKKPNFPNSFQNTRITFLFLLYHINTTIPTIINFLPLSST